MLGISANLKNKMIVMETNIANAVPKPAFNPKILIKKANPSSVVDGMVNSDKDNFSGKANFITFAIAFVENKTSRIIETILAWIFRLGKRFLIPLPKIDPCKIPIPNTIANDMRKFS